LNGNEQRYLKKQKTVKTGSRFQQAKGLTNTIK